MTTFLFNDHQVIKLIHTFISGAFLVVASTLFFRAWRGYFRKLSYSLMDRVFSYAFIINLYLQLIFGLLLMAYPAPQSAESLIVQDLTTRLVTKRFWPVEHIVLMLFALFIANLGLIFSNSTPKDREKHRKVLVYYSIAIAMIGLSLSSTYW